jgi:hypothetical protein
MFYVPVKILEDIGNITINSVMRKSRVTFKTEQNIDKTHPQSIAKMDKWNFINLKSFNTAKEIIIRMKG